MLRRSLYLSTTIIVLNFFIGINAPTTLGLDDEIWLLDHVWRAAQGQRVGIDYHDPLGFGPSQLGALLWYWLGPHHYILRLTATLISLSIAFCGCIVANRRLGHRRDLALLFCAMLAFELSAPSVSGAGPTDLGMAMYYNRLIVSALAVLFLQAFTAAPKLHFAYGEKGEYRGKGYDVVEIVVAAFLLDILFLVKISGPVVGIGIMLAGCLMPGCVTRRLLKLGVALLLFAAMAAIEFRVTGLEVVPVIREYALAAQGRLTFALLDVARAASDWQLVSCVTLLLLFALARRSAEPQPSLWYNGLVVGSFTASQLALNLTNAGNTVTLAPAAAAALAVWGGLPPSFVVQASEQDSWWRKLHPVRLAEMSARDAIPFVIFALVLVPQVTASGVGAIKGASLALGLETPTIVTAGTGVNFRVLAFGSNRDQLEYAMSVNHGIRALAALDARQQVIANLDFGNPFPLLFQAPSPKGVYTTLIPGFNVPRDIVLDWRDVIGDACIVTVPMQQQSLPEVTTLMVDVARQKLADEFTLVHQDEWWSIYKGQTNCFRPPTLQQK